MKRYLSCLFVVLVLTSALGCSSTGGQSNIVSSLANEPIVTSLMSKVGVSSTQAVGGLGSMLAMAKGKVSADQFSQLTSGIPSADKYIGALGGLGIDGGSIKDAISLKEAFRKLGMNDAAVEAFGPAAINAVRASGGEAAAGVLSGLGF